MTASISAGREDYLLLTPGPLTTSNTIRQAMNQDLSTWDVDYNQRVQSVRQQLVRLATSKPGYTSVLMQGSGSASVEATLGTVIAKDDKLLIISNGVYGMRMAEIADYLSLDYRLLDFGEVGATDIDQIKAVLDNDRNITHVAIVHCETTTGRLNPLQALADLLKKYPCSFIVDAMSSFGGIPIDVAELGIDYLISSSNKCIQGVPGFGFVIARQSQLEQCVGQARSLSLDLYDQWLCMEKHAGKWRFTSPTHVLLAFEQALLELQQEGGVSTRYQRYCENQQIIVTGMQKLGFQCLLPAADQSPIITSFYTPEHPQFEFQRFYDLLKQKGFVIYPGKVSKAACFRIGSIGHVFPDDFKRLISAISQSIYWQEEQQELVEVTL